MKKMNITKRMSECGALAIVREENLNRACEIAEGCIKGGITVIEMSYTINNAGEIIQGLNKSMVKYFVWEQEQFWIVKQLVMLYYMELNLLLHQITMKV